MAFLLTRGDLKYNDAGCLAINIGTPWTIMSLGSVRRCFQPFIFSSSLRFIIYLTNEQFERFSKWLIIQNYRHLTDTHHWGFDWVCQWFDWGFDWGLTGCYRAVSLIGILLAFITKFCSRLISSGEQAKAMSKWCTNAAMQAMPSDNARFIPEQKGKEISGFDW